jgi:hypothetical protein
VRVKVNEQVTSAAAQFIALPDLFQAHKNDNPSPYPDSDGLPRLVFADDGLFCHWMNFFHLDISTPLNSRLTFGTGIAHK